MKTEELEAELEWRKSAPGSLSDAAFAENTTRVVELEVEIAKRARAADDAERARVRSGLASGFDAMGKPVPPHRKSNALKAMREMVPKSTTLDQTLVIDRVAAALERDEPYEAFEEAQRVLDLTGAYRLVATLLTG